ncbi:ribonuclease M5 [Desulfitispora alkaliphila]|uniref:ribonuclease M5 n=1 Tax=Desulfitispora alkaliphila TaxID=622674 RepID=UPI003D1F8B12
MTSEIIVVEGKDDVQAVKCAVDCELITTNGFALSRETIKRIKLAQERRGVIILTDPDYVGDRLRERIEKEVPGCKHAFLPRNEATAHGDVGVENATPEAILTALKKARFKEGNAKEKLFEKADMYKYGIIGVEGSQELREALGRELGIGYGNGKQFLNRLNSYGITREEFVEAIVKIREKRSGDYYEEKPS